MEEPQNRSGGVAVATADGGESLPVGPSSDPNKPGAAIALAAGPGFGDPKPPSRYSEDESEAARDARDGPLKPRVRDLLNEAVGAEMYGVNWNDGASWCDPRTGESFNVSRYYMHLKIAVDFPGELELEREVPMKQEVFRSLGIVYVVVAPGKSTNKNGIVTAIADQRKMLKGGE